MSKQLILKAVSAVVPLVLGFLGGVSSTFFPAYFTPSAQGLSHEEQAQFTDGFVIYEQGKDTGDLPPDFQNATENRFKLTRCVMAQLVRLRQATVEAAKSLSFKELNELVKSSPDHEVDRIDRRVGLILAARAKLPGAGHLKAEDRNALRALADGAELIAIPSEHRADEIAAELHTDMPWMGPANELAWHAMRRSVREGWKGFRLLPMLLDGLPGIGKSQWARKLGEGELHRAYVTGGRIHYQMDLAILASAMRAVLAGQPLAIA